MLHGIYFYQESTVEEVATFSLPALLDSGTTLIYMRLQLIESIANSIGAYPTSYGYVGPCDVDGGLTFDFSGAEIHVPFEQIMFEHDFGECFYGISPSDHYDIILGDIFLHSAYIVYDIENFKISLANAKYDYRSASIEDISSSVPRTTKAK